MIATAISAFVEKVKAEDGKIDVLVNNAGITRDGLLDRMSEKDWDMVIDVNLKGVFNMTQFVSPIMIENGAGSIITMSSVVGTDGNIGQTNYAATRLASLPWTKSWAKEFSRKGAQVRANCVAPGFIKTPMTADLPGKSHRLHGKQDPAWPYGRSRRHRAGRPFPSPVTAPASSPVRC